MISSTTLPRPCLNCCASSRQVATKSCTWCRRSPRQRWQSTTIWSGHGTSTRPATTQGPNQVSSRPSASEESPKKKIGIDALRLLPPAPVPVAPKCADSRQNVQVRTVVVPKERRLSAALAQYLHGRSVRMADYFHG